MKNMLTESVFLGAVLTLLAYEAGLWVKQKTKSPLANPLLIAVVLVIGILTVFRIDFETYNEGARYIGVLLTPATVSLAIPLYRQLDLLKKYPLAILGGVATGVAAALVSVLGLGYIFHLSHEEYITLLPKSITTAIGMGISDKMGGFVTITVVAIVVTGIVGHILADLVCRICRIEEPIAVGLAIGTSAHALGTTKAMELGDIEGAMSSLSIVVAGIMTVVGASLFARFL